MQEIFLKVIFDYNQTGTKAWFSVYIKYGWMNKVNDKYIDLK